LAQASGSVGDFYAMTMAAFEQNVQHNLAELQADVYGAADDSAKELRHALGEYSQVEDMDEREAEHYEKGWTAYKYAMVDGHVSAVVANANSPQLTHLIEKGHEKFVYGHDTGERTKARPHIRDAYEHARSRHFSGGDVT